MLCSSSFSSSGSLSFGEKIGVIPIEGPISESLPITSQLIKFRKDKKIKAIIIRIDSPGGGVGASQEIYKEIVRTNEVKKVVASMGGVAASGGYYIASATEKIVANPGTITGSIGVIMEFLRLQDLFKKIGIEPEVIKSGEFKDIGSPHREMTERDKVLLNELINDIQEQFVLDVASGRKLKPEKVKEIADGRIFTGARAKELGLVDSLGNFHDAVDITKKMVGIQGEVSLVYPAKSSFELLDRYLQSATKAVANALQGHSPALEYKWQGFGSY